MNLRGEERVVIGLMNHITRIDQMLFCLVNGTWTNPLLDRAMPTFSWIGNLGAVWIALLGAMAAFGKKTGSRIALAGFAAFALGFVSSELTTDLNTNI